MELVSNVLIKDLYDIFAAVLFQVTLTDHRVMFKNYPYTFTTDEAVKVMSELVFIHLHRHPDPADPSRQVATRTTTTFSMDSTTAKNLIQHFLSAKLIMNATDPNNKNVRDRGLYCPTLKGKYVLEEFTDYTQVEMSASLIAALNAPYMSLGSSGSTGSRIISLDRLADYDDQITFSRPNMTAAFKAMMSSLPLDVLLMDEIGGLEKMNSNMFQRTFVGLHCIDWLTDRLTVMCKEEAEMVASEFVLFGWIAQIQDKSEKGSHRKDDTMSFKTSRNAIYYVTERGCTVVGWKINKPALEEITIGDSSSGRSIDSSDSNSLRKATMRKVVINTGKPNKVDITPSTKPNLYQSSTDMKRHDSATVFIDKALPIENMISNEKENCMLTPRPPSMSFTDSSMSHISANSTTALDKSQFTRLNQILETPLLRMYFRDFLRSNYCVENINFWVDHHLLLKNGNKKSILDQISECYSIYETYLGPAATADVNIDHTLHQEIIKYVSSVFVIVSQLPPAGISYFILAPNTAPKNHNKSAKSATRLLLLPPQANSVKQRIVTIRGTLTDKCLGNLLKMFLRVNDHVCRMMAEDSVPKFIKTTKYKELMIQQQQALQSADSEEEDDDDEDYYYDDSEDDEIIRVTTALSDQRISVENIQNYPLESMVSF